MCPQVGGCFGVVGLRFPFLGKENKWKIRWRSYVVGGYGGGESQREDQIHKTSHQMVGDREESGP